MKKELKIFIFLAIPVMLLTVLNKIRWDNLFFINNHSSFGKFMFFMNSNVFGLIFSFLTTYLLVRLVMVMINKFRGRR